MPEILIIADDLTGALDSAVAFVRSGRRVHVARGVSYIAEALAAAPDVLAVSTASRECSEGEALERMAGVAAAIDPCAAPIVMKKVDSRLKGHVAAETRALACAARRDRIVALPAIPEMGRVQCAGMLTGEGIEHPVDISACFPHCAEVPDITSDADLDAAVQGLAPDTLWAGARGLAFALARATFGPGDAAAPALAAPAVFALGSRDPITLRQAEWLGRDHAVYPAPNGAVEACALHNSVLAVQVTGGDSERPAAEVGAVFADGIARLAETVTPGAILASGGETADAILNRLGIGVLEVEAELAPGVPVCVAEAGWGKLRMATKSGGFGAPDLLIRIAGSVDRESGARRKARDEAECQRATWRPGMPRGSR